MAKITYKGEEYEVRIFHGVCLWGDGGRSYEERVRKEHYRELYEWLKENGALEDEAHFNEMNGVWSGVLRFLALKLDPLTAEPQVIELRNVYGYNQDEDGYRVKLEKLLLEAEEQGAIRTSVEYKPFFHRINTTHHMEVLCRVKEPDEPVTE